MAACRRVYDSRDLQADCIPGFAPCLVVGLHGLKAKFHYTGLTGPAPTRTTRISEKLRWSMRVSDNVLSGPVGPV